MWGETYVALTEQRPSAVPDESPDLTTGRDVRKAGEGRDRATIKGGLASHRPKFSEKNTKISHPKPQVIRNAAESPRAGDEVILIQAVNSFHVKGNVLH